MGRPKKDFRDRRIAIGITLPVSLLDAIDLYNRITGSDRSKTIEKALLIYLSDRYQKEAQK